MRLTRASQSLALTLAVAALLSSPCAAQTGESRTVVLCAAPGGTPSVRDVAVFCAHLEQQLADDPAEGSRSLIAVDRTLTGPEDFDPAPALERAHETLAAAREAEASNHKNQARKLYLDASEAIMALEPWLNDRRLLADALLGVARVALESNHEQWMANEAAIRALNILPAWRRTWRQTVSPGPVYDLLAETSEYLAGQPSGSITVTVNTPGAKVFLDGDFAGIAPLVIRDVPPGEHLLAVRKAGYIPKGERVAVAPKDETSVSVQLNTASSGAAWNQIVDRTIAEAGEPRSGAALAEIRSLLLVEQIIVVRLSPDFDDSRDTLIEGYIYDLRSRQLLALASIAAPLSDDPAAARTLMEKLDEGGLAEDLNGETSILNTWWFWTSAAAVALGTVGVVLLLTSDGDPGAEGAEPLPPGTGTIRISF